MNRKPHPLHPAARLPVERQVRSPMRATAQRYLPTLFDRLCDDAPSQRNEAPGAYVPDRKRMQEILQRDLGLLLNTINHEDHLDVGHYPEVAGSCANFGVPPLAGRTSSGNRWAAIEAAARQAILRFEPRIAPETLVVKPLPSRRGGPGVLSFEISGQVHMLPYPMEFIVQTSADLEAMRMEVQPSLPPAEPGPATGTPSNPSVA